MNLSHGPVGEFLDGVDIVLNSNTFLLPFDVHSTDVAESLGTFLKSEQLLAQLIQQDRERGWNMMYYFDDQDDSYKLRGGNILKNNFQLKLSEPARKRDYLIAMLTGDESVGRFFSFYGKQKTRSEAEMIIDNLISFLFADEPWELYKVEPDFLKSETDTNSKSQDLRYFEGGFANDTATVMRCKDKGYLLLTNGID